jgi:hypothetical protein
MSLLVEGPVSRDSPQSNWIHYFKRIYATLHPTMIEVAPLFSLRRHIMAKLSPSCE